MKTLAVVIGNDKYHESAELNFAVKDAQGIADVFVRLGYDVIHNSNINNQGCSDILKQLSSRIADYDATIFFFAGHGFQFEGENYLTSIDCQIPPGTKYEAARSSILLTELMDIYKKYPDKINIVIIDACRKSFGRGTHTAFAPVQAPQGTLIAFSTSPEESAKDGGMGDHSIYTGALLQYIGREKLSVEELFKKVRRTVYHLTGGRQTPWEHTSLIGDFNFNTGQLFHSPAIPYSEEVVKDAAYQGKADEFSTQIIEIRSCDWNRQNPAIDKLLSYQSNTLDKNQQFILGRNLLQAGESAFNAGNFFEHLSHNLKFYLVAGENHLLNGILFEIYFNSKGEFRNDQIKMQCFEAVMGLRKNPSFTKSFEFITALLAPHQTKRLMWIPTSDDTPIDVDVLVTTENRTGWSGETEQVDVINSVKAMGSEIIDGIRNVEGQSAERLKAAIASYFVVPESLVQVNSNRTIQKIGFVHQAPEPDDIGF